MEKQGFLPAFSLTVLLFTASALSAADAPKAVKSKPSIAAASKTTEAKPAAPATRPQAKPSEKKQPESKVTLGDAFIAQNALRIYLNRPATITVHNARGQLLFQFDSARPMENLPLNGLNTGFLYLTLRTGQLEMTKKLVYSGK